MHRATSGSDLRTVRQPSDIESGDADVVTIPSDYLEVEMTDAGGTVTVLHRWQEPSAAGVATRGADLRRLLALARVAADGGAALLAVMLSGLLVVDSLTEGALWAAAIALPLPIVVALLGGYRQGDVNDVPALTAGAAVTAFVGAVAAATGDVYDLAWRLVVFGVALVVAEFSVALVWSGLWRSASLTRRLRLRTAVVADAGAEGLEDVLASLDGDLTPIAVIDGGGPDLVSGSERDKPATAADRVLRGSGAECLLVVAGAVPADELDDLRRVARLRGAEMRLVTRAPSTFSGAIRVRSIDGHAVMLMPRARMTRTAVVIKRAVDLILGTIAAVITMPIMLAIAVAIKATSPGPVLFRQERVTRGGRVFRVMKFRTMTASDDHGIDDREPFFKLQDDPRLTKIGEVIRPLSLDELPQLWNVLKGEMSLVGPRPLPREQVQAHPDLLGPRHDVPAGMTGWWQINGRSDLAAEEAVLFDRFYIENWSVDRKSVV